MSELSFKYCPVCGEPFASGKILLPASRSLIDYVWWFSEESAEDLQKHPEKNLFCVKHNMKTALKNNRPNVPAGYCKKCDRIFAEFEIRDGDNPIGE